MYVIPFIYAQVKLASVFRAYARIWQGTFMVFFKNGAKRQAMLKEFQIFCNVDPHKILRPAQTRWLSLLSVVKRILEQWEPLRLFFTENYMEHRLLASEEVYNALNNF
jgi:hypothetical protein